MSEIKYKYLFLKLTILFKK